MDVSHQDQLTIKTMAEREELFRYADLSHPLIAVLFNKASLDELTTDASDAAWL